MLEGRLVQQFNVKTDGPHEEIHVIEPLLRHVGRKSLGQTNRAHDAVFHSKYQPLLFIRASTYSDGGQELPNIDIFARSYSAGEDVVQRSFQRVEEEIEGGDPVANVNNLYTKPDQRDFIYHCCQLCSLA